jgi:O-antigen ligase
VGSIAVALVLLSLFLLGVYLDNIGQDVNELSDTYAALLGAHRNDLATFFIVGFPFLIARLLVKKDTASVLCLGVTIAGTGILFSRAAYFNVLFALVFYPILSKRRQFLPGLIICSLMLAAFTPSIIKERGLKGLEEGDANEVSAGRVEDIWAPLVDEYINSSPKLLLGNGRRAIVYSDAAKEGKILEVDHPHNMYLELILDSGLVGLAGLMPFYIILLTQTYRSLKFINEYEIKEYQYAVIVSLTGFLISGLTNKSLFPGDDNFYLWVVMGFAFSTIRWSQYSINSEGQCLSA